jgi:hypothetical protein
MNATLSLSSSHALRTHLEVRPAPGLISTRGDKVSRVALGLWLVILVQAGVVALVIGAAWAGTIELRPDCSLPLLVKNNERDAGRPRSLN